MIIYRHRLWVMIAGQPIKITWAWFGLLRWDRESNSLFLLVVKIHKHKFDIDDEGKEIKCIHCKQEETWPQVLKRIKN